MRYPGQWSYNSNGYIVNAENTDDMTGFYNPTTNYSDMDISISMGSWNGDDDTLGAMIRFSEDKDHNCTGYVFAYDGADVNGGWIRGLYKINGKQFAVKNLEKVVDLPTTHWQRGTYETVILLSWKAPDAEIKVRLDMSELDITSAESNI